MKTDCHRGPLLMPGQPRRWRIHSELPLDEAFNDACGSEGVFLQHDFAVLDESVRLHEDFARLGACQHDSAHKSRASSLAPGTYQLLLEYQVPDLALPPGQGRRQLRVVLARARAVRSALPYLQLDEKRARDLTAVGEHFVLVHLRAPRVQGHRGLCGDRGGGRTLM